MYMEDWLASFDWFIKDIICNKMTDIIICTVNQLANLPVTTSQDWELKDFDIDVICSSSKESNKSTAGI